MRILAPLIAAFALGVAGASAQSPVTRTVTPEGFQLPEGGDCTAEIARYRAIQDNDLEMGHVAQSVYNKIKAEIAGAERECSAGRDAQAKALVVASKKRHGYPVGD